jgi:hypothetical protein
MTSLCFMGIGPVEEFRCRIYSTTPRIPLTDEEARAELLAEATAAGADGFYPSRGEAWDALVDVMCDGVALHLYLGKVYLGPDYKRQGEP